MDPASVLGIASACLGLALKIVSTGKDLADIVSELRGADKTISQLAIQIDLIGFAVTELQQWLKRDPSVSRQGKLSLNSAIESCNTIVSEIKEHVRKVRPKPGEETSKFGQRVRLLWNEKSITNQKEMLSHTLQAFQLILAVTQLYVSSGFCFSLRFPY